MTQTFLFPLNSNFNSDDEADSADKKQTTLNIQHNFSKQADEMFRDRSHQLPKPREHL